MDTASYSHDRQPAVANQFYPGDREQLEQTLDRLFRSAKPKKISGVRAIISPHAGYVFSGEVAASAFQQIDNHYNRVFVLGSSHQFSIQGASVYCAGDYIMPYGREKVDTLIGKKLVNDFPGLFNDNTAPHAFEHSLEVQLPFLHHMLKGDYSIIPIIIGSVDPPMCHKLAAALEPWFTPEHLFVISSDFSHYPNAEDATRVDAKTMEAICINNPNRLIECLKSNVESHIPGLSTSLCGWTSVLTLINLTTDIPVTYHPIEYRHSGFNTEHGDNDRVVGYWAIAVSQDGDKTRTKTATSASFNLTANERNTLLSLARKTLQACVRGEKPSKPEFDTLSETLRIPCGAFVTLHLNGNLRGCIGTLETNQPLFETIKDMTVSAALHDYRFLPVGIEEIPRIDIELSVLSPLKTIEDPSEIVLSKHGILIEKGNRRGVFLPQVATETGWDLEEFLGHCARDKAGIEWDGWKTATIKIFTCTVFGEK